MKKERGVSLIAAVLIIAVIIFIACAVVGIIIGKKNQEESKRQNIAQNIIEEKPVTDEPKKENKEVTTQNTTTDANQNKVDDLVFTEEYLQSGQSYGNVEIINNRIENLIELSISGKAENGIDEFDKVSTKNRWYKTIDLTDYNTLQFYARNANEQGDMMICIDDNLVSRVRYTELTSTWSKYTVDISRYKGNHTIAFAGGYADNTGSEQSNTRYSRITLKQ